MGVRRGVAAAAAALMVMALAGCGNGSQDGSDAAPEASPTATETWDLVVLADSSGWGLADAWAELIRKDVGVEVNPINMATSAQTGGGLLDHLTTEGDPQREAVRQAEVVSVWASSGSLVWTSDFNDCVMWPDRRPTHLSRKDFAPYAKLWRDVLAEISKLREGQPTAVRTRDIYNPVISRWVAAGTAEACTTGLRMVTKTVQEATRLAGATFVPVYRGFNGPDRMADLRELDLLKDGEHLNDQGIALMAQLHHEAGYEELTGE